MERLEHKIAEARRDRTELDDLATLGAEAGSAIALESRRGRVVAYARADRGVQRGVLFMPFAYNEVAANLLTNDAIDPFGKFLSSSSAWSNCARRARCLRAGARALANEVHNCYRLSDLTGRKRGSGQPAIRALAPSAFTGREK
jgi:predicted molibdopterin-dependent oxidoreductase YjgC